MDFGNIANDFGIRILITTGIHFAHGRNKSLVAPGVELS
jgi:hypothetical protein